VFRHKLIALLLPLALFIAVFGESGPIKAASVKVTNTADLGTHLTLNLGKKWSNKSVVVDYQSTATSNKKALSKRITTVKTDAIGLAKVCGATVIPAKSTLRVRFKSQVIATRRITKTVTLSDCTRNEAAQSPTPVTTPTTAPSTTTTIPALAAPSSLQLKASSDTGTSSSDGITKATVLAFTGSAPAGSSVQLSVNNLVTGTPCTADSNGLFECSITGVSEGNRSVTAIATLDGRTSSASNPLTIIVDRTGPTMTITPERSTVGSNATYDIAFTASESVSGFTEADVELTCVGTCSVSSFTGSGANYSYTLSMTDIGHDVYFQIDLGTYTDLAGNLSFYSLAEIQYDMYGPQATLTPISSTTIRLTFDEAPTGLDLTDFQVRTNITNDCVNLSYGTLYSPGHGLTNLRSVNGSTTVFDIDHFYDINDPPRLFELEIAGTYEDEWGNAVTAITQPDLIMSTWCN